MTAQRDCCCCSRHPAVVSSSITALVMVLLAQGYLIWEMVFNFSNWPRWQISYSRSSVPALSPGFDFSAALCILVATSVLIHTATDRVASVKAPPFRRCFLLLTLGIALQSCSAILVVVESCATSTDTWWFGSNTCRTVGGLGGALRLFLVLLPTFVADAFCVRAYLRQGGGRIGSPPPSALSREFSSTVTASADDGPDSPMDHQGGIALGDAAPPSERVTVSPRLPGGDPAPRGESPPVTEPLSKPLSKAASSTPETLKPRRCDCRAAWSPKARGAAKVCLAHLVGVVIVVVILVEAALRRPCTCVDADWGPTYEQSRYCRLPADQAELPPPPSGQSSAEAYSQFETCDAFAAYLRAGTCGQPSWYARSSFQRFAWDDMPMDVGVVMLAESSADASAGATASGPSSRSGVSSKEAATPSFSETNVQVEGIDEADIVKTDGSYIYTLTPAARYSSEATLNIVRAWPTSQAALLSSTYLSKEGAFGVEPRQMMLHGDMLLVIGTAWQPNVRGGDATATPSISTKMAAPSSSSSWGRWGRGAISTVRLLVFDVSNRAAPKLVRAEELEGYFVSARKVGSQVYAVCSAIPVYPTNAYAAAAAAATTTTTTSSSSAGANVTAEQLMPLRRTLLASDSTSTPDAPFEPIGGGCGAVGYVASVRASRLIVVASIDLADNAAPLRTHVSAGRGSNIYASSHSLYVASNARWTRQDKTMVTRFALENGRVSFGGLIGVEGYILNQWAMDEYRASAGAGAALSGASGVTFRIVTTTSTDWRTQTASTTNLFTYAVSTGGNAAAAAAASGSGSAAGMAPLGSLVGLAPTERVFAVRFMGTRLYVVTFRQVDPLFVIDVSAPATPVLLGQLKVPGYSDYLHPVNASHLIGIGKDASLDGQVKGLKLALFDASTPTAPAESYSLVMGDRGTHSAALDDHKAFTYDADRRLLTLPVRLSLEASGRAAAQCDTSYALWQGAVVWRVGESAFDLRGLVPHYDPAAALTEGYPLPPPSPPPTTTPADAGSGAAELPPCRRHTMSSCGSSASYGVERAIYIGEDALYTISPRRVRADSLEGLANLTANASSYSKDDPRAAAAWQRALAGSKLAEVALPHDACSSGGGGVAYSVGGNELAVEAVAPVSLSGSVGGRRMAALSVPAPNMAAATCSCECTTTCQAPIHLELLAAREAMGL